MVIIGDVHWKDSIPYKNGLIKLFNWLVEKYKNETIIFTGDYFDSCNLNFETYNTGIDYALAFKQTFIISGNHESNDKRKKNCLIPFTNKFPNLHIILDEPIIKSIEGKNILLIPFTKKIKELESKLQDFKNKQIDLIICHQSPIGDNMGHEEIDLTDFKADVIYGHIHSFKQRSFDYKHVIIGVPQTTRELEQNINKYIIEYTDKIDIKEIPTFFDIQTIEYGETAKEGYLLNVKNAPSIESVYTLYPEKYIRNDGISIVQTEIEEIKIEDAELDIKELWINFCIESKESKEFLDFTLTYF